LDIFIPNLNLAFEFHGEQHFQEITSGGFSPLEFQKFRDLEKIQLCEKHAIKLIIIPYWWDNNIETLVATILREYPGILKHMIDPNNVEPMRGGITYSIGVI